MQRGTVQFVDYPDDQKLDAFTARSAWRTRPIATRSWTTPAFRRTTRCDPNGPIKHVIYIIKENRTYDQVLGDMKQGNGDPSLDALRRRRLRRIFTSSRASSSCSTTSTRTPMSARTGTTGPRRPSRRITRSACGRANTPGAAQDLRLRRRGAGQQRRPPDTCGRTPRRPASRCGTTANVDRREKPAPDGRQMSRSTIRCSQRSATRTTAPYDLDYPDVDRAKDFISRAEGLREVGQDAAVADRANGQRPHFRHDAGKIAPLSAAADNDQGVGMLVEAVSKSRFWNETAIFVIEDDAQNGPDHVDSHRAPAV